jgi:hypothetical protein
MIYSCHGTVQLRIPSHYQHSHSKLLGFPELYMLSFNGEWLDKGCFEKYVILYPTIKNSKCVNFSVTTTLVDFYSS